MAERTIRLIPLSPRGESGVKAYIMECENYAKAHPYKTKVAEQLKKRLGTTEEYFENPLQIVVTIRKEADIGLYQRQIEIKLEKLMQRYKVQPEDYAIEVD